MDIALKLATNLRPSGRLPSPRAPRPGGPQREAGSAQPAHERRPTDGRVDVSEAGHPLDAPVQPPRHASR